MHSLAQGWASDSSGAEAGPWHCNRPNKLQSQSGEIIYMEKKCSHESCHERWSEQPQGHNRCGFSKSFTPNRELASRSSPSPFSPSPQWSSPTLSCPADAHGKHMHSLSPPLSNLISPSLLPVDCHRDQGFHSIFLLTVLPKSLLQGLIYTTTLLFWWFTGYVSSLAGHRGEGREGPMLLNLEKPMLATWAHMIILAYPQ